MLTFSGIAKVLLLCLSAAGFYSTWSLSFRNGFFDQIMSLVENQNSFLPGTEEPLKLQYVGIPALDKQLAILVTFWYPLVDGRTPEASLHAFKFVANFIAIWVVFVVESYRLSNKWRVVSFTTFWGLMAQNVDFATAAPLLLALHLFTSPASLEPSRKSPNTPAANLVIWPGHLLVLPFSVILGVVIPSVLACLPAPDFFSYATQQNFIALWQAFPLWITLSQLILCAVLSPILPAKERSYRSAAERNAVVLRCLRTVYFGAFALAALAHVASVTLSVAPILFPNVFVSEYRAAFHPLRAFAPVAPWTKDTIVSLGQGALRFMQWDEIVGCTATLIWALVLNRNAHAGRISPHGWFDLALKVVGLTILTGPAGAVIALIWGRDELVLGDIGDPIDEKKLL
ncbi:hypothetical protein L228DRAFT_262102 [Xylona heveae TC161]|uniref:AtmA protein n=1 Tax=Xylona heveae (strain CBS 132557 / TC161) TaxID=1328760 RepID=A0A165FJ27_XYLHT|nr:hypothetical protein L228DRAFT_262102 [Xylona heveae TC161]KZF21035.1 hypothetical protein L228DRAFT_262102 [Xylona heveae TC161]